jgi:hypothetical protein
MSSKMGARTPMSTKLRLDVEVKFTTCSLFISGSELPEQGLLKNQLRIDNLVTHWQQPVSNYRLFSLSFKYVSFWPLELPSAHLSF